MKALTGVDVMIVQISSSVTAEICSMITFIAYDNIYVIHMFYDNISVDLCERTLRVIPGLTFS